LWVSVFEFCFWAILGLVLGFAGHWWQANAAPWRGAFDEDRGQLNMALADECGSDDGRGYDIDDAGRWDYDSLRNLAWCLMGGVVGVPGAIYATTQGHAVARDTVCQAAGAVGLAPIFCP
jgi:hypothetical protein